MQVPEGKIDGGLFPGRKKERHDRHATAGSRLPGCIAMRARLDQALPIPLHVPAALGAEGGGEPELAGRGLQCFEVDTGRAELLPRESVHEVIALKHWQVNEGEDIPDAGSQSWRGQGCHSRNGPEKFRFEIRTAHGRLLKKTRGPGLHE